MLTFDEGKNSHDTRQKKIKKKKKLQKYVDIHIMKRYNKSRA